MTNYLFFTNTENFVINNDIINKVNLFLKEEVKTNYFLKVLKNETAYEWNLVKKLSKKKEI